MDSVSHLRDFSDRLPAMLVKELRQGLRAPLFIAPFLAVQAGAILAVGVEYERGGTPGVGSPFWLVAFLVVVVLMPLRGFAALREECEGGNSALLMLGGLSRWQIVGGKWLVQIVLCGLTFLSLLPYLFVRYFLGGFEIIPNALMAVNVMTMSAGVSGCIIGASGYRSMALRFIVAAIGIFWVMASGRMIYLGLQEIDSYTGRNDWMVFWIGGPSALGVQLLYAITGLQLGRAHLKLYLLPFETAPARNVVSLMIFLPFILLAGGIGTMGVGFPVVLLVVIVAMIRYDSPWRPPKGQRPQEISGTDTGWRPLS